MKLFGLNQNWVKCGQCSSEFDFNKNEGCPFCGFGSKSRKVEIQQQVRVDNTPITKTSYLAVPNGSLRLKPGRVASIERTMSVGSWGMFNSFFPGKAVARILARTLEERKTDYVVLDELVDRVSAVFQDTWVSELRGFPNNPQSDSALSRLVHHFVRTFAEMGLFEVKAKETTKDDVWNEPWGHILITLTKEGLEFAKLKNRIFDDHDSTQVLTDEEIKWLGNYLKRIDKEGYREYSLLKAVYDFIISGHNGKNDLWEWFSRNRNFVDYVKNHSRKSADEKAFNKQLKNLSTTFASSKIALLRELGVIKNKRDDYTIIGGLD